MKMISFAAKKGGVGKTTICKNVAYKLAKENKKILLIDLDPQATLSTQFITSGVIKEKTITNIITAINLVSIDKIIQKSKFDNLDIIIGGEDLNKTTVLINTIFQDKDKYVIADELYKLNKEKFDDYDYVLVDYPPTIQELAINFLLLSDLVVIPINGGVASFKGLIDLKNTLNKICRDEDRNVPEIKIIFNNIKDDDNTGFIFEMIKEEKLDHLLSNNIIKNSDVFIKTENDLDSIWNGKYYWRQKQVYEDLIKEIE